MLQAEARRRYTADVDAENRRLIEAKAAKRKESQGLDREEVQKAVHSEVNLAAHMEEFITVLGSVIKGKQVSGNIEEVRFLCKIL
jgi:hypothetical protein